MAGNEYAGTMDPVTEFGKVIQNWPNWPTGTAPQQTSAPAAGMMDIPLSNDMSAEPLDVSSIAGPPQEQKPAGGLFNKDNAKQLAPLLMMLPLVARQGPGAIASLMRGFQKGQARRSQQGRTQEGLDLQRQRLEYDRQRGADQRRQDARRWLSQTLPEAIAGTVTPAERDTLRQEARRFGSEFYELPPELIDSTFAASINKGHAARIRKRVDALSEDARAQAHGIKASLTIDGETVPYADWAPFDAQLIDPSTGQRMRVEKPKEPRIEPATEFEAFFRDEYLPAVKEEREASGHTAPMTRTEMRDLKLQARGKWEEAGRAPRQPTPQSRNTGAAAARTQESRLDEEVAYLLRNPTEATPRRWGQIVDAYGKLGVSYQARRDAIARRVARDDSRGADDFEASSSDDLLQAFDDALGAEAQPTPQGQPARGRGTGPGPATGAVPAGALQPGRVYRWNPATGRLEPR